MGTPGEDRLEGTEGRDVIVGLGGGDQIDGRGGDDLICAGPGGTYPDSEEVESVHGGNGDDRINGGAGAEYVRGGKVVIASLEVGVGTSCAVSLAGIIWTGVGVTTPSMVETVMTM